MVQSHDPAGLSNGGHAVELIHQNTKRLVELHGPVLANRDPEPLHQMRVTMRRLRTCLHQFAPALQLPATVNERRIAKVGRRLGMARDLDVLRDRLQSDLLPHLGEAEGKALRPVLKQLRRERAQACEQLEGVLRSGNYLEMLSRLQRWQKEPRFTPLGEQPLQEWLVEWQAPLLTSLFSHPGWFVADLEGDLESVHDLRKQFKNARYGLENLASFTGRRCREWARRFKALQELLGELNDLQVLQKAIDDQLPGRLRDSLPRLHGLLQARADTCWGKWRSEAEILQHPWWRHRVLQDLLLEQGEQGMPPQRIRLQVSRLHRRASVTPTICS
ncbi:MAG TPA: CHAD domain-containing protein [Cyanobium sp.]|nr:CHAD domain-containing protein [Cyanobium sp.]